MLILKWPLCRSIQIMKKNNVLILVSFAIGQLTSNFTHAGDRVAYFSPSEMKTYKQFNQQITDTAAKCLNTNYLEWKKFFAENGFSYYYGDRDINYNTENKRLDFLKSVKKSTSEFVTQFNTDANFRIKQKTIPARISKINNDPNFIENFKKNVGFKPMSCIGLTRKCLAEGFDSVDNSIIKNIWNKIDSNLKDSDMGGMNLIKNLQKLGWKVLYWNPDPSQNSEWDQLNVKNWVTPEYLPRMKVVNFDTGAPIPNKPGQYYYYSAWGMHESHYKNIMNKNRYFDVRVDDKNLLVNTKNVTPLVLQKAPYYIGTAHVGYHVFSGYNGQIYEGHSERSLTGGTNLEHGYYNPATKGGSPKSTLYEQYRSGIIVVPPGYLENFL